MLRPHPLPAPPLLPATTPWARIITLWLCGVGAAMQFAKISLLFKALQTAYALSAAQMGLLLSTVGVVGLAMGVTVGLLAPAIGYRRLLLGGLGLGAALSLLQSLAPPYPLFWLTRVLEGASHLAVVVAAPTLIVAGAAPRHRAIAMGLWSTFFGVAFALTALAVRHVGTTGLLQLHALVMALLWVTALLLVRGSGGARPAWPRFGTLPRLHATIYTHWATALPGACFFFYTVMAVALLTFIPQQLGRGTPWLAVVLPLVSICGTFSTGWLAQYWVSPARLVQMAFSAVALAGMALGVCLYQQTGVAAAALVLMYLVGLAGGAGFALVPYLASESAQQARATGAIAQLGNLGSTSGPPVFAALIATLGSAGLVLPVVVFALLGLAMAHWGVARHHHSQLQGVTL